MKTKPHKCTDCQEITLLKDNGEITVGYCSKCGHPLWNPPEEQTKVETPGEKKYIGFSTEGNMIPQFRNPIILHAQLTKNNGYKILQHLYGSISSLDTLKVKVGTGHWIYPYTQIFDTKEQADEWVKKYWNDVLKQIEDSKEKVQNIIDNL